jgi:glycosyltransferase involved in cell wall biosynthesis
MNVAKIKLIKMTTVPISMNIILKGQLAFLNQYFEVLGVTAFHEKHFHEIEKREGIRMIRVDMARAIAPFSDIQALIKLYFLFKKERPFIVHTQTPKAGLLGMLAAYLSGVPVRLHTVGGLPLLGTKGIKRSILNILEKITYACAHKVYPNSIGLKNIIVKNGFCQESHLKVLANGGSNGIDTNYFSVNKLEKTGLSRNDLRAKYGIGVDDFVFLFVGRIAIEKGFNELLNAFEKLKNRNLKRPIKLLLIGTFEVHYGVVGSEVKEKIETNPDIFYLGRFDDVRPFYWISDVYVFPSYREGFPNTLLEAGAMGLPLIATDINGCNEIVVNNVTGILIPAKDEFKLEEAMYRLQDDLILHKKLASEARRIVESKFKRELVWDALLSEYKFFLSQKHIK